MAAKVVAKIHYYVRGWANVGGVCGAGYGLRQTNVRSEVTCLRCRKYLRDNAIVE